MKSLAYAVFAAALCFGVVGFVGLGFWRVAEQAKEDLGVLVPQVDALASVWQSKNVPAEARAVTIVLGDAGAPGDFLAESPMPSRRDRLIAWLKSAYGDKTPSAPIDSLFVKAFSGDPNIVAWTYDGLPPANEPRLVRELKTVVEKANAAGAEVDFIVQGRAVVPAFKALKSLEKDARAGAVGKFLAVGGNPARYGRMDSTLFAVFKKPDNVAQWLDFWQDVVAGARRTQVEVFDQAGVDGWLIRDVYPRWEGQTSDVVGAVKELVADRAAMAGQLRGKAEAVAAADKAARLAAAAAGAREPNDPTAMVTNKAPPAGGRAQAARDQPAPASSALGGTLAQRTEATLEEWEAACARCCADTGGRFNSSSRYTSYHFCDGGRGWDKNVPSCADISRLKGIRGSCRYESFASWEKSASQCCVAKGGVWDASGPVESAGSHCCRGIGLNACRNPGYNVDHPLLCEK